MSQALIETVRVVDGEVPLWDLHLERLARSAQALGMARPAPVPPDDGGDIIVRYLFAPDGSISVTRREVPPPAPLALTVSSVPHCGYPHKLADRGWLDAAAASAAVLGADDALLLDGSGQVIETTRWAIGWWSDDRLVFPPLASGGLPSVARARTASLLLMGIGTEELTVAGLAGKSLVACNAARGVAAVVSLDGATVPPDRRTMVLAEQFWRGGSLDPAARFDDLCRS